MSNDDAICQDCLRVHPAHPTNEGTCPCGGDTCNCSCCRECLRLLREGHRDRKLLGLQSHISNWSEESGCEVIPNE